MPRPSGYPHSPNSPTLLCEISKSLTKLTLTILLTLQEALHSTGDAESPDDPRNPTKPVDKGPPLAGLLCAQLESADTVTNTMCIFRSVCLYVHVHHNPKNPIALQ